MKKVFLLLVLSIALFGCSKDDNPVEQQNPMLNYVGNFSGASSQSKTCSFTVTNIDSKAFLTYYKIEYEFISGSSTVSGSESKSSTNGIIEITDGKFNFKPDSEDDQYFITGEFTSANTLNGSFSIVTLSGIGGGKTYTTGTFTAQRN